MICFINEVYSALILLSSLFSGKDHEILSVTWVKAGEQDPGSNTGPSTVPTVTGSVTSSTGGSDGNTVIDVADLTLTTGEHVTPLVWSPFLTSPLGTDLSHDGSLRVVNRTDFYRCHEPV